MAKRTKSSQLWLERQRRDPYVKKAAAGGLGSRAHFKLAQLDERFSLLRPHMAVLELGSAPGGWTRYLAGRVHDGRIVAVDYRPMPVPRGVVFLCLDIYSDEFEAALDAAARGAEGRPCFVGYVPQHQWSESCGSGRGDGSDRTRDGDARCDG